MSKLQGYQVRIEAEGVGTFVEPVVVLEGADLGKVVDFWAGVWVGRNKRGDYAEYGDPVRIPRTVYVELLDPDHGDDGGLLAATMLYPRDEADAVAVVANARIRTRLLDDLRDVLAEYEDTGGGGDDDREELRSSVSTGSELRPGVWHNGVCWEAWDYDARDCGQSWDNGDQWNTSYDVLVVTEDDL